MQARVKMPVSIDDMITGLWKNGRDSIIHALHHFSERGMARSDQGYHDKWIIVSIYHAVESICNMRLLQLDPNSPAVSKKEGHMRFPSLSKTLKELGKPQYSMYFSPAECQLFRLLGPLPGIRHQFMHGIAPEMPDVSIAAMCMIGLLKQIERLRGESASDIVWQSPPIEGDVVSAIRYTHLEEYSQFVALFLREKYADRWLPECPSCGVRAVVSSTCEACFTELDYVRCPKCDKEVYFTAWERAHGVRLDCPHCGRKHTA